LLQLGDGRIENAPALSPFSIRLPDINCAPRDWTPESMVDQAFPSLQAATARILGPDHVSEDLRYFCDRAILAPKNKDCDEINAQVLIRLPKTSHSVYLSSDSVDAATEGERHLWPTDFLNTLTPSGMPPHELVLAPGALVMLLRNLDIDMGLCNGVRAIVLECFPRVLDVLLVSGTHSGKRVYIPRVTLAPKSPDLPFVLRRRQFPVKLAWCMTINKAQGQTLKNVAVYLPSPVFAHGQLYVAMSRAGSAKHVRIYVSDTEAQGWRDGEDGFQAGIYTDNVVWHEALLHPQQDSVFPSPPEIEEPSASDDPANLDDAPVGPVPENEFLDAASGPDDHLLHDVIQDTAHVREKDEEAAEYGRASASTMNAHIPVRVSRQPCGTSANHVSTLLPRASGHDDTADRAATNEAVLHLATSISDQEGRAASSSQALPGPASAYPFYFEKQKYARCGLHALNNALGMAFLTSEDMVAAFRVFIEESHMEGCPENPSIHIHETGWYSEAVMAQALRVKHNLFRLDLDKPIQDDEDSLHRIFADSVLGVIVNIDNVHWVAIRVVADQLWLLDSEGRPQQMSFAEYRRFLQQYRNKFVVEQIQE
jgi:hypothetical protein